MTVDPATPPGRAQHRGRGGTPPRPPGRSSTAPAPGRPRLKRRARPRRAAPRRREPVRRRPPRRPP
ncbi:hypothetical protein E4U91_29075 [Streptomyces lasalocidi]|uniref:Uncharacterized protein n=1 Tax=Streptomyces lasalocidi TaxID=324833 RepID=A0A4U5WNA2_STRLS|nr:hypothetical protein E4U91_29075 [Streptomyces lasalocidi]